MKKYFTFFVLALFLFIVNIDALTVAPVDVTTMSIEDLLEAFDKGYLTSEVLVNIYLERIDAYDELFNSINQINEHAIEQAKELDKEREEGKLRGRLHGIPILVKCNIDVYGMPTTAGTKALKDNYPNNNAFAVQKLIDEGAVILGSTNMSEMAFSAANSRSSYGYVRNVFNTAYTSYGSSGGAAVSVKAAFAAASLGTDTNSSVRLPASGAGLVGMRPTLGLVSRTGVIPYDIERDTIGVLSRDVSDNVLLLSIMSGKDENDTYTKDVKIDFDLNKTSLVDVNVGVVTQYVLGSEKESGVTSLTNSEIYEMLVRSIKKLEDAGANIVFLDKFVTSNNLSIASSTYAGITMCDNFNDYIKGTTGSIRSFEDLVVSKEHIYDLSGYLSGCGGTYENKKYRDAKKAVYRDYVDKYFDDYELDIILYPTLKNKPYAYNKGGNISPGSSLGSVIGYPSITVPMGYDNNGFSYGIEFMAQAYDEAMLYNVAIEFEKVNGNVIETSLLTPSLYEIPDEVIKLKEVYEKVLEVQSVYNVVNDWLDEVKVFFKNYNASINPVVESSRLLKKYEDDKIEKLLKIKYDKNLNILFTLLLIFTLLLFVCEKVIKRRNI